MQIQIQAGPQTREAPNRELMQQRVSIDSSSATAEPPQITNQGVTSSGSKPAGSVPAPFGQLPGAWSVGSSSTTTEPPQTTSTENQGVMPSGSKSAVPDPSSAPQQTANLDKTWQLIKELKKNHTRLRPRTVLKVTEKEPLVEVCISQIQMSSTPELQYFSHLAPVTIILVQDMAH